MLASLSGRRDYRALCVRVYRRADSAAGLCRSLLSLTAAAVLVAWQVARGEWLPRCAICELPLLPTDEVVHVEGEAVHLVCAQDEQFVPDEDQREGSYVLCPECLAPTYYLRAIDCFICEVCGLAMTGTFVSSLAGVGLSDG